MKIKLYKNYRTFKLSLVFLNFLMFQATRMHLSNSIFSCSSMHLKSNGLWGILRACLKGFMMFVPPNSTEVICEGYKNHPIVISFQHDIFSYKVSTLKQFENSWFLSTVWAYVRLQKALRIGL